MSKEKKYYNSLNHINDNISSNNEFDDFYEKSIDTPAKTGPLIVLDYVKYRNFLPRHGTD